MAKGNNIEKAAENLLKEVQTILEGEGPAESKCEDALDYLKASNAVRKLATKRSDRAPKPKAAVAAPKTETKLDSPKVEPAVAAHAAQANGTQSAATVAEKRGLFGR